MILFWLNQVILLIACLKRLMCGELFRIFDYPVQLSIIHNNIRRITLSASKFPAAANGPTVIIFGITYNLVSIPTPWAVAGAHGQLAIYVYTRFAKSQLVPNVVKEVPAKVFQL